MYLKSFPTVSGAYLPMRRIIYGVYLPSSPIIGDVYSYVISPPYLEGVYLPLVPNSGSIYLMSYPTLLCG